MRYNKVIKQIAKEYGVSPREAEREMMKSIQQGRENPDPQARAKWIKMFGDRTPSVEEFINAIAKEVKNR